MGKSSTKILFFTAQILADGTVKYHWKPSPRLRKLGWSNLDLGTDFATACTRAIRRNEELTAWQQNRTAHGAHLGQPSIADARPRTIADLIVAYTRSDRFTGLSIATKRTYHNELRKITLWSDDGRIPVAHITRTACLQLRDHLVDSDAGKSATANFLRVLRLLLQYAVDREIIGTNPALKLDIPEADSRGHIIRKEAIELLDTAALALDYPSVRLAMMLGFWTMQRQSDLLSYTASDWRPVAAFDVRPETRQVLSDPNGAVWGLHRMQNKTKKWIAAPVPPPVRHMVQDALTANRARRVASTLILPDDRNQSRYHQRVFQRRFARVRMAAWYGAMLKRDWRLAKHIRSTQFRDFRRTGMCYFGELVVPVPLIAAISGHSIDYTQKILAVYMPNNTAFAIMGVAEAITRAAERSAIEQSMER
jgi:hypothetical protein